MDPLHAASENLRIIRQLMERATVYRAVSGPTAFVAGLAAILAAVSGTYHWWDTGGLRTPFFETWMAVLALVAFFNALLLWRGARLRGEALFTQGFRLAMRALLPPLAVAFVFSLIWQAHGGDDHWSACLWISGYGLALLATRDFAPRSIVRLGGAFLIAGLVLALARHGDFAILGKLSSHAAMALTFGLFHLLYAACVPWKIGEAARQFSGNQSA
ncbi:MAG: hypothetical protein AB7I98_10570 [Verrucomicrobiales bacterium]|nr:hypothetical protein [Verrucomicrobiae bacterium]MCP5553008.1 hypothetical protein [Akkermansiaceae bacterium]